MNVSSVLPLLLLHTRAVLSSDAVAILLPSGDHATETTELLCPVSVRSVLPVTAMNPDETPSEPNTSDDVRTNTMPGCLEMLLLEKPDIVTTKAAAGITAPAVVMTTDVAVVAPHVPVSPATLLLPAATVGVMDGAKKPEGYVSVMVPPAGTGFDAVNPSVTGTDVWPALRSIVEMLKYTSEMG